MKRFGIIGTGIIAKTNIQALMATGRAEIVALCNRTEEKARQMALEFGLNIPIYSDHKAMLDTENLDVALLCTPQGVHCKQFIDCANAGVDVLVEKPLAMNYKECTQMMEAAKTYGIRSAVCHTQRYLAPMMTLKELLQENTLGEIVSINDTINMEYYTKVRPLWFFDVHQAGSGMLFTQGSHQVDRVMYILGEGPAWVMSDIEMADEWLPEVHAEGLDCGYHIFGKTNLHFFTIEGGGYSMPYQSGVTVRCTKGIIRMYITDTGIDKAGIYITRNGDRYEPVESKWNPDESYIRQMNDLLDELEGKPSNAPSLQYASKVIEVLDKVKTANITGNKIFF